MLRPHIPHGMYPVPITDRVTFETIEGPAGPGEYICTEASADDPICGHIAQPYVTAPDEQYGGRASCMHHWVRFDEHPF